MSRKKKIIIWAVSSAAIICLALLAYFVISSNRPTADTLDPNIFDNWPQQSPDLNSTIILPDKYSGQDLQQKAGNDQQQLSGKAKEINDYAEAKILELLKKPVKSNPSGLQELNDLVIKVVDSSSKTISFNGIYSTATKRSVADNFIFDPSVSQEQKDILLLAYPNIENIYGARENSVPIRIIWDQTLERGGYAAFNNTIYLDQTSPIWEPVHELVHAFRGDRALNPFFEEGSAVVVTSRICEILGLTRDGTNLSVIQAGYDLDSVLNHPSIYEDNAYSAGAGNNNQASYEFSYEVGGAMMSKLFVEDNNFFKNLNKNLFATNPASMSCAPLGLPCTNQLIIKSISQVEGQSTSDWLAAQSYFTYLDLSPQYSSDYRDSYYPTIGFSSVVRYLEDQDYAVRIRYRWLPKSTDFAITLREQNGTILANDSSFINVPTPENVAEIRKRFKTYPAILKQYYGVIKMEATPNNDAENKTVSYLIQPSPNDQSSVYIYDPQNPDKAIITNLTSGEQETIMSKNGYFASGSEFIKTEGKFKIETFTKISCKAGTASKIGCFSKVGERIYNKFKNSNDSKFMIQMSTSNNDCVGKINKVSQQNDSLRLDITSSKLCGKVIAINNIPLIRSWNKSYTFVSKPLATNIRNKYSVFMASNWSIFKTLSGYFRLE